MYNHLQSTIKWPKTCCFWHKKKTNDNSVRWRFGYINQLLHYYPERSALGRPQSVVKGAPMKCNQLNKKIIVACVWIYGPSTHAQCPWKALAARWVLLWQPLTMCFRINHKAAITISIAAPITLHIANELELRSNPVILTISKIKPIKKKREKKRM